MKIILELYIVLQLMIGAPLNTLVSAENALPAWYEPEESKEARAALDSMSWAAAEDGILLWVNSGYRSYGYQEEVYAREGQNAPNRYRSFSARAGHSEHQLGTAFDVSWPGLSVDSLDERNLNLHEWLEGNAGQYGFILSYPYKEIDSWPFHNRWIPFVTEYIYEPWHIRYVGVELAQQMILEGYLKPDSATLPQDFYIPWP